MKTLLAILVALGGCTTIDRQVIGFPQDLKVTTHENAGFLATQKGCFADMPWYWHAAGGVAIQCATVNLPKRTCDIYTINGAATEHEFQHCKGGDHDGSVQDYFDRWMLAIDAEIAGNPNLYHPRPAADIAAWRADYTARKATE